MPFSVLELFKNAIEDVPQYIIEVQPLTKLCIGKITTHIWSVNNPLDVLIEYYNTTKKTKANKKKKKGEPNYDEKNIMEFKQVNENITDQIMSIESLPKYLKVKISMQFLHLIQDMLEWSRIQCAPVLSHNNSNAIYFLNKTVFTSSGTVDMSKSVLRGLFDAYGNIELNLCLDVAYYCFFNSAIFDNYIQSNKYIKDKKLIEKVKKRMYEIVNYRKRFTNTTNKRVIDSVHGTVEALNYHYKILAVDKWTKFLYLVASLICNTKNKHNFSEKIIFIYYRLDPNIWESLLEQFYMVIIPEVAVSGHYKYCLLFYKQLKKINPEACLDIIAEIMSITNEGSNHQIRRFKYCDKIYQENMKYILLMIWENTPLSVKRDFIDKNLCGQMFCCFDDYEFVVTFIKDAVITDEERALLVNYLVLCHEALNDDGFIKENLVKLRNDFNIAEPSYSIDYLKCLLIKCSNFPNICRFSEHIYKCGDDLDIFRTSISKDHKFLMDVIYSLRGQPNAPREISNFLVWCFIENENDIYMFVEENLKCDLAMVRVYLDFLSERRKLVESLIYDDSNHTIFDDMFNFSEFLFDTEAYFHKVLDTILTDGDPDDLSEILRLGSVDTTLLGYLESYLLSEDGLKHILKTLVIDNSKNFMLSFTTLSKVTSKQVKFKQKWLINKDIDEKFGVYMVNNGKELYKKHFKHLEKNDSLLCPYHEDNSMWKFSTTVELVYKIFAHIVLNVTSIENVYGMYALIAHVSKPPETLRRLNDLIQIASITLE